MRHLPNALTLCRLCASPIVAVLIVQGRYRTALALVVFAGVTDWADGFAARRFGVSGKTGIILDPLADKVLLVVLFIALAAARNGCSARYEKPAAGLLPIWLLFLVIGRDLIVVIGAGLLWRLRGIRRFVPAMLGKVSTFFQIVFVVLVLLRAAFPSEILRSLEVIALVLTTIFTAASGVQYVSRGIEMTRNPERWQTKV